MEQILSALQHTLYLNRFIAFIEWFQSDYLPLYVGESHFLSDLLHLSIFSVSRKLSVKVFKVEKNNKQEHTNLNQSDQARPLPAVHWPCPPSTFIHSLIPKASLSLFLPHCLCPLSTPPALSVSLSFHSSPDSHAFPIARASWQCHSPWCQCLCLPRPLALLSHSVSFWPGV